MPLLFEWKLSKAANSGISGGFKTTLTYFEVQSCYNQTQEQPGQLYLRGSELAYNYSYGLVIATPDLQVMAPHKRGSPEVAST